MGFWGSGLYQNDSTCDLRDDYIEHLRNQLSNEEAYEKIMEAYKELIGDEEEEPLLWYALADTQWRVGRLMPEVKEKALMWIKKRGGLDGWADSQSKGAGWLKTLEKLRVNLEEKPMPPEKRICKRRPVNDDIWEINDMYAYQFHSERSKEHHLYGKYIVLQKIASRDAYPPGNILPSVCVYDRIFDEVPSLDDIKDLRFLPMKTPDLFHTIIDLPLTIDVRCYRTKKEYPERYLTFIGNKPPLNIVEQPGDALTPKWREIEQYLGPFYLLWRDKNFTTYCDAEGNQRGFYVLDIGDVDRNSEEAERILKGCWNQFISEARNPSWETAEKNE